MRNDVLALLNRNGVTVELKGYKEMSSTDGYHMQGSLYVNGKKAIFFEDLGVGGECDIYILNESYAKPLTDIKDELAKLSAYPEERLGASANPDTLKSMSDMPYRFDNLFYEMAEDYAELKDMRRHAKKKTLVQWENETYEKGEASMIIAPYSDLVGKQILSKMLKLEHKTVKIWNIDESWKTYTADDLKLLVGSKAA